MRILVLSLVATAGVALATPAFAQGVYFSGPGVSIGAGHGDGYHGYARRYHDDFDHPRFRGWSRSYGAYGHSGGCRDITVRRQGWDGTTVKHIRRCD